MSATFPIRRIRDSSTAQDYTGLTFPSYRPLLQAVADNPGVFALGADDGTAPIGLGLAEMPAAHRQAELRSLAVDPAHRGRGVATALLGELDALLRTAGAESLSAVYATGQPSTAAVERLLKRGGFAAPIAQSLTCVGDIGMVRAPVLGAARLPAGASITLWQDVDAAERARIENEYVATRRIPDDVGPFCYEHNLIKECCFALRYHGQVIGWALSQDMNPDTVRMVSAYVLPDFQSGAFYPCLQVRLIDTVLRLGRSRATWTVDMSHQELIHYHRAYLLPYLVRCDENRRAEKRWSRSP